MPPAASPPHNPPPLTPELLAAYRLAACALAESACGGAAGKCSKLTPTYIEVTEGRDGPGAIERRRYSSCGDLGHWLLARMGVADSMLNRGRFHRNGMNIAKLSSAPLGAPCPAEAPRPGDICIVWSLPTTTDAHVCVALEGSVAGTLRTANYGAGGMSESTALGARIATPPLVWVPSTNVWKLGAKTLWRIVRLERALQFAVRPPNLEGAELAGEVIDALEAAWATP